MVKLEQNTKGFKGCTAIICLFFTTIQFALSQATYYVSSKGNDSYTGTEVAPFRTIEKAINSLDVLLTEKDKDQDLHADSAYTGEEQDKIIEKYEMKNKVHEKGYRNRPLTEEQKASNTKKTKIRARVEHVFGFMEQSMKGLIVR